MKPEILNKKLLEFYKDKNLPKDIILKTIPLIQERIRKFSDYLPLCEFFFNPPKKYEIDLTNKKDFFKQVSETLNQLNDWKAVKIGEELASLAKKLEIKNSQFFMDMRVVITGKKISPPLNESMEILGKEECLKRLNKI
jgi:glutamyl-tRNA synthetase